MSFNDSTKSESRRCLGINKNHSQCKKSTRNESQYCNLHEYQIQLQSIQTSVQNLNLDGYTFSNFFLNDSKYRSDIIQYDTVELLKAINTAIYNTNYDLELFVTQLLEAVKTLNLEKYIDTVGLIVDSLYTYINDNLYISTVQYTRLENILNSESLKIKN